MANISIDSFQQMAQVGGKVALDQSNDGGLKTYGNSFLGKLACWFQPKSSRTEQSNKVMQSFINSIKSEFGREISGNIVQNLESQRGKRLSSRTISRTISDLNRQREVTNEANKYASTRYSTSGTGYFKECFESNFTSLSKSMGMNNTQVQDLMQDTTTIEQLQEKISQSILDLGKNGQHHVTPTEANQIAKFEIRSHFFKDIDLLTDVLVSENPKTALDYIDSLPGEAQKKVLEDLALHLGQGDNTSFQKGVTIGKLLVQHQINKTESAGTFMRTNNPSSRFNVFFMKALGGTEFKTISDNIQQAFQEMGKTNPFLTANKTTFDNLIRQQVESELGPLPDGKEDLEGFTNWKSRESELINTKKKEAEQAFTQLFYDNVLDSVPQIPQNVKTFLREVKSVCSQENNLQKFGKDLGNTLLGDNVFLRTLFPNNVNNKIMKEIPMQIQGMQRAIVFGNAFFIGKNPNPEDYSLLKNTSQRIGQFLDQIST